MFRGGGGEVGRSVSFLLLFFLRPMRMQKRLPSFSWAFFFPLENMYSFSSRDAHEKRRFYINHVYHSCPGDVGWMAVKDQTKDACTWGTVQHVPAFLYSPSNHDLQWDGHGTISVVT